MSSLSVALQEVYVAFYRYSKQIKLSLNSLSHTHRNAPQKILSSLEGELTNDPLYGLIDVLARLYSEFHSFDDYMEVCEFVGASASAKVMVGFISDEETSFG